MVKNDSPNPSGGCHQDLVTLSHFSSSPSDGAGIYTSNFFYFDRWSCDSSWLGDATLPFPEAAGYPPGLLPYANLYFEQGALDDGLSRNQPVYFQPGYRRGSFTITSITVRVIPDADDDGIADARRTTASPPRTPTSSTSTDTASATPASAAT